MPSKVYTNYAPLDVVSEIAKLRAKNYAEDIAQTVAKWEEKRRIRNEGPARISYKYAY